MAESPEDSIFEEREELMVSFTGGIPTLRTAHFLKPTTVTVTSINGQPTYKPPSLSLSSESNRVPLKVNFNGWRDPQKKWKSWVNHMDTLHHSVWKKAGIYEAIISSTYQTRRDNDLIFTIAENWCSETNTFVFPFGEATITLEDMMILGGFSVLGCSVSKPLHTQEFVQVEEHLNKARIGLVRSKSQKASHLFWINHFMESGKEFEHEAFLCLWLSRFVFPGNVYNTISPHLFSIAIHLSRGTRIALGPAVLASIYRDLSLLKSLIFSASTELKTDCHNSYLALTLWAPLRFVQVWAWERFPSLRPKPNMINSGEPRLAQWHCVKRPNLESLREAIDSSGESFQWRPYAISAKNWFFPKFYKEKEEWVSLNVAFDEDLESFIRVLRVCELVGIDCIEHYLPHRVSMQFGMDQDVPIWVSSPNSTAEIAWENYNRSYRYAKVYVPSRLFESDVTTQYLNWWKQSIFAPGDFIEGVVRKRRTYRKSKRMVSLLAIGGRNDCDFPPGFPPKCNGVESTRIEVPIQSEEKSMHSEVEIEMLETGNEDENGGKHGKSLDNIVIISDNEDEHGSENGNSLDNFVIMSDNEGETSCSFVFGRPILDLEARISKLERVVARLKAERFGNRTGN